MSDEKKNGTLTPQKQEAIRNIQRAPEVLYDCICLHKDAICNL